MNFRTWYPEYDEIQENLTQMEEENGKHTSAHDLIFIMCMTYLQ